MTLTSWIKYDHEIQKNLIDANVITFASIDNIRINNKKNF